MSTSLAPPPSPKTCILKHVPKITITCLMPTPKFIIKKIVFLKKKNPPKKLSSPNKKKLSSLIYLEIRK